MHLEFNDIEFCIKDIEFIRAETLNMDRDCILLRISMQPSDGSTGLKWLFGFHGGVTVASRFQLGLPA